MTNQSPQSFTRLDTNNLFTLYNDKLFTELETKFINPNATYSIPATQEPICQNRLSKLCTSGILDLMSDINTEGYRAVIAGGIVQLAKDNYIDILNKKFSKKDIYIILFCPNKHGTVKRILT